MEFEHFGIAVVEMMVKFIIIFTDNAYYIYNIIYNVFAICMYINI